MKQKKLTEGFCQVKKIQKSEKNSELGGWVKPKLGFFLFCVFCVCFTLSMFPNKSE